MNYNENDITLFDQFLENVLSEEEKNDFLNQLESHPNFKNSFESYQKDIALLVKANDQIVLGKIQKAGHSYSKIQNIKKIALFSIGLILITLVSFFILNKKSEYESPKNEERIDNLKNITVIKEEQITSKIDTLSINYDDTPISTNNYSSPTMTKGKEQIHIGEVKIIKVYTNIVPVNKLNVKIQNDTIIIFSPKLLSSIIPFTKKDIEYLLLDRTLFKKVNNEYVYTNDNRPADLIQKSTGKGENKNIRVVFYITSQIIDKQKIKQPYIENYIFKNDTLNQNQLKLRRNEMEKELVIKTRFLTLEDMIDFYGN